MSFSNNVVVPTKAESAIVANVTGGGGTFLDRVGGGGTFSDSVGGTFSDSVTSPAASKPITSPTGGSGPAPDGKTVSGTVPAPTPSSTTPYITLFLIGAGVILLVVVIFKVAFATKTRDAD